MKHLIFSVVAVILAIITFCVVVQPKLDEVQADTVKEVTLYAETPYSRIYVFKGKMPGKHRCYLAESNFFQEIAISCF